MTVQTRQVIPCRHYCLSVADVQDIAALFAEWLESKSYHEAARAVEGDVMGVKRVRNEVSVEVERALLGTSLGPARFSARLVL